MSVYCVSDLHGHFDELMELLENIEFDPAKDELYILGDIIDRGPQSAELLWWIIEESPSSVHCLLGNHEDMMLAAANNYYNRDKIEMRMSDPWAYNYGHETLNQIREFDRYYDGWEKKILDWVDCLPLYYDINVDGKRFVLVHAALQSKEDFPDDCCFEGKNFIINIDGVRAPQQTQAMLWNRRSWISDDFEWPFDIVCGHTPVIGIKWDVLKAAGFDNIQTQENGIVHLGKGFRKHMIDCGVNRNGQLGCLRLDDMREFYVKKG